MSGVEVWQSLPTFKIGPKKTFFGMDKNSAHTFKLPKEMDNAIIELLNLGEGNLQSEIKLIRKSYFETCFVLGRVGNGRET